MIKDLFNIESQKQLQQLLEYYTLEEKLKILENQKCAFELRINTLIRKGVNKEAIYLISQLAIIEDALLIVEREMQYEGVNI